MNRQNEEQLMRSLETRELRRLRADDRADARMDRLEREAEHLIGELCREGRTVFYINLRTKSGRLTGKTREGSRCDLIAFLTRNNYV